MSKNNGSPVVITDWIRAHAGEITEWEVETRCNFDYYLEVEFVKEGIKEIGEFLNANGMCNEKLPEIDAERERKLRALLPDNLVIKDDFELNCYYWVFRKRIG